MQAEGFADSQGRGVGSRIALRFSRQRAGRRERLGARRYKI
jgi:hypothetical protein